MMTRRANEFLIDVDAAKPLIHAPSTPSPHEERERTPSPRRNIESHENNAKNDAGLGRQVVGHFLLSKLAP